MLAEQIASLRKQAGMSQQQLANKLMVVPSTIGMYEQGRRIPSIDILIQMAEVFQVSLDFLITGGDTVDTQAGKGGSLATAMPAHASSIPTQSRSTNKVM